MQNLMLTLHFRILLNNKSSDKVKECCQSELNNFKNCLINGKPLVSVLVRPRPASSTDIQYTWRENEITMRLTISTFKVNSPQDFIHQTNYQTISILTLTKVKKIWFPYFRVLFSFCKCLMWDFLCVMTQK